MTVRLISADPVALRRWRNDTAKADSAIAACCPGFDPDGAAA